MLLQYYKQTTLPGEAQKVGAVVDRVGECVVVIEIESVPAGAAAKFHAIVLGSPL